VKAPAGIVAAYYLISTVAYAQTPSPTPSQQPGGIVSLLVSLLSVTATWLSARAAEYGGSPLLPTVAAVLLIILFVALLAWLRRPKKPLDTHAPV
jgi:protein-S-isoprenylcysteine O-methyltransferase Ste14